MLLLTTDAAAVLKEARSRDGIPDHYGVRIHRDTSNSQSALHLRFAEMPAAADEITERDGLKLFIDPEIAGALSDQSLVVDPDAPEAALALRLETQTGSDRG